MELEDLRRAAASWIEDDPDPETREELEMLLAGGDEAELRDRFAAPLAFGTAGLRGLLGAGPNRMNHRVVARTTAGLCRVLARDVADAETRGVVVGFDARRNSREFAERVADVAAGLGFRVRVFDRLVPTPLVSFAVTHLGAAAGVMVTASHNPPGYNGYKVFWGNGAQIVPPLDSMIAEQVERCESVSELPRAPDRSGMVDRLGDSTIDAYFQDLARLLPHPEVPRHLTIAYTPLHGVGAPFVTRALTEAGFSDVRSVPEQVDPNGDFPTVAFPNPEEPGAMDAVLDLARRCRADLVIASDPDADRLAVAIPGRDGGFRTLGGNEIGCLLAHYLLQEGASGRPRLVLNTIVSSPMLLTIAKAHGAQAEQTLTGFKWIMHRALERTETAPLAFAYEEALGYCVGEHVRDKDGISAALVVADLTAWCQSQGRTVEDELDQMARLYGLYVSRSRALMFPSATGAAMLAAGMARLRATPPATLGGVDVVAVADYRAGERRRGEQVERLTLPEADVLAFELADGGRVMARPSGTEPKLKLYLDVRVSVMDGESTLAARRRGETQLASAEADAVSIITDLHST